MRRVVVLLTGALMMALAVAGPAAAHEGAHESPANAKASCIGIGSSITGTNQERDDIARFLNAEPGPAGHVYSFFAKRHAGSEAACFQ